MRSETTSGLPTVVAATRRSYLHARQSGCARRQTTSRTSVARYSAVQYVAAGLVDRELIAGGDLINPRQGDLGVGAQMHQVPGLIAEPPPDDDQRGEHDDDEERRPHGRGHHAQIAREEPPHFRRNGDAIHRRIPDGEEDHMREHERETDLAVAPVLHRKPVEPTEQRQPG